MNDMLCLMYGYATLAGVVGSIRVGYLLGGNNGSQAKLSAQLLLVLMIGVQTAVAIFYVTARNYIGSVYSDDRDVIEKVAAIAYIAAIFQVCDGVSACVGGILKGMGHQLIVAGLNFIGFWLIGTLLGGTLAFVLSWGVSGIWWGLCVGLFFTSALGLVILSRIDFDKEAMRAQRQVVTVAAQSNDDDDDDNDGAASKADTYRYEAEMEDGVELMRGVLVSSSSPDPNGKEY